MHNQRQFILAGALCAALLPAGATADPAAVDLADSLDFEQFHAMDEWSIGIGQDQLVVTRTEPGRDAASGNRPKTRPPAPAGSGVLATEDLEPHRISNPFSQRPGSRYESPVAATESLFRSMAETCPQGWQKDREWTTPTDDGFLLHFEFHCLDNPS